MMRVGGERPARCTPPDSERSLVRIQVRPPAIYREISPSSLRPDRRLQPKCVVVDDGKWDSMGVIGTDGDPRLRLSTCRELDPFGPADAASVRLVVVKSR